MISNDTPNKKCKANNTIKQKLENQLKKGKIRGLISMNF